MLEQASSCGGRLPEPAMRKLHVGDTIVQTLIGFAGEDILLILEILGETETHYEILVILPNDLQLGVCHKFFSKSYLRDEEYYSTLGRCLRTRIL